MTRPWRVRGRSILVAIAVVVLVVIAIILVARTPPPIASPSATVSAVTSPTPSTAVSPTASPSPSSSPSASPRPPITVTATGPVPADHAFVLTTNTGVERVLLLDLAAKRSREVVRFDRPLAANRSVVLSASFDGQVLAILERSDGTTQLHIVRPVTGDLRTLPQQAGVDSPNISPDGKNVAVSWTTTDPQLNGLWLLPVDGSVGTRIIAEAPGLPGSPPKPRAWTIDGRWLAAFGTGSAGNQILVVDTRAGSTTYTPSSGLSGGDGRVLTGIDAAWRGIEVLAWTSRASPGTPAVISYDAVTRATATVFTAGDGQNIIDVVPRPNSRQFAVRLAPFPNVTVNSPNTVVLIDPTAAPRPLRDVAALLRLWWSPDGAHLWALVGGDDSTGGVIDLYGGDAGMSFCLRGGDPPRCT